MTLPRPFSESSEISYLCQLMDGMRDMDVRPATAFLVAQKITTLIKDNVDLKSQDSFQTLPANIVRSAYELVAFERFLFAGYDSRLCRFGNELEPYGDAAKLKLNVRKPKISFSSRPKSFATVASVS